MQQDNMNENVNLKPEEFSLITVFKLLKYNLKFFISFVLIVCVIVVIYSLIMPHTYSASASILPPKKEGGAGGLSSYLQSVAGGLDLGGMGQSDQSKLFAAILGSRTVAEFVIDDLKLKEFPELKELNDDKLVKFVSKSISNETDKAGIIYIGANYTTSYFPNSEEQKKVAKLAADMANSAVAGLDRVVRERSLSSAKKSKEYIESQLLVYRARLDSVSQDMEDFQRKNKVISIDDQAEAIVGQAIEVGSQLAKSELEYNLAQLEFNDNSPRLKFYKEQLELLNEQYRKIQSGGITGDDAFAIPLDSIPTLMKEFADLFRQRKIYEQVIMYLETQHHQEAIQEKRDIPIVEVLDVAKVPFERTSPNRFAMLVVTFFISIILGIFIIIVKAFVNKQTYILDSEK